MILHIRIYKNVFSIGSAPPSTPRIPPKTRASNVIATVAQTQAQYVKIRDDYNPIIYTINKR